MEPRRQRRLVLQEHVQRGTAELPVVLLEDTAALLGLVFALIGVGLTVLTGNGIFDGLGTIAIGLAILAVCGAIVASAGN